MIYLFLFGVPFRLSSSLQNVAGTCYDDKGTLDNLVSIHLQNYERVVRRATIPSLSPFSIFVRVLYTTKETTSFSFPQIFSGCSRLLAFPVPILSLKLQQCIKLEVGNSICVKIDPVNIV